MKKTSLYALLVAGLAMATALSGCGTDPASSPTRQLKKRPAPAVAPIGGARPGAMPGAAAQDPKALLAMVKQAADAGRGFTATVDTYENSPAGSSTQTLKIAYKKPNTLKIDIVQDSGGNAGVQALWSGGSDLKVKPKFPPIAVTLPTTDKRLTSKNGWTIKDTGVSGLMAVALDPSAQVQMIGEQQVGGKLMTMLDIKSRLSPKGADHEIIGIDKSMMLPGYRCVYQGTKVLYKMTMKTMNLTPPSASAFSI